MNCVEKSLKLLNVIDEFIMKENFVLKNVIDCGDGITISHHKQLKIKPQKYWSDDRQPVDHSKYDMLLIMIGHHGTNDL